MKEATIYNALQNNFTQVSNEALVNARLSGKAYKLYAYMCYRVSSYPSWVFNRNEILKHFTEGETAMRGAFKELIDAGFLERMRIRNDKGIFEKTDYKIYSTPINKGSSPQVENPPVDNQQVEKPRVDNPRTNNKDKINKDSNNKDLFSLEGTKKHFSDLGNKSDGEEFWDHWEQKGWKKGKDKITDRAAAARSWERNHKKMYPDLHIEKKEKTQESKEIENLRENLKKAFISNQLDYDIYLGGNAIEKRGNEFFIVVDEKAEKVLKVKYQSVLEKFNVKLEVK